MKRKFTNFCLVLVFIWLCGGGAVAKPLHHYVFFGMDREKINNKLFIDTSVFEGAQVAYGWNQLEPGKDEYDFGSIREDLAFLTAHHKKLWIQIQDVSFGEKYIFVPRYLLRDPQYNGGADRQYRYKDGDEEHATPGGWMARRWDSAVQDRFRKLLFALGKEFDGRIEGINLAETSCEVGETGRLFPKGFTFEIYRDAIISNLQALKRAFPKSVALQYVNFMPGEWANSKGYLGAVFKAAKDAKIGVGGPDLLPYQPPHMNNSYRLIKDSGGIVPVGIAVQDGNYEHVNPQTKKRVTIAEMIAFGTEYLKADYIFWCTQEPFFANEVVPFLKGQRPAPSSLPQTNKSPDQIPTLELNQPLNGELKGGVAHTYKIHLEAATFARVLVLRQGVDVYLRAVDGQGKFLAQAGDSFGRIGPLVLPFVAETRGDYFVQVTGRKGELGGKYEIKCIESRPVMEADRTLIEANKQITAGNVLRGKAEAESNRQALVHFTRALTLYKQINDKAGQAMALQQTGRIYEAQSDYHKALEFYSSALVLWREVKDRRGEGFAINFVGGMNYYLGNLAAALPLFEQAREIHRDLGNKEEEGLTYHEIGILYRQEGNIAAALECLQQALAIFREVGAGEKLGYLLNNLGVTYRDIGELKTAADYENQALQVFRDLGTKHGTATVLTNLASISSQQGEMRSALSLYQQALPLCIAGGEQNCEARAYWQMAAVYSSLGETQTALDFYGKSAEIYRRKQRPVELARMLNSSGALYSSLGEKTRAFELYSEALTVSRKAESRAEEATTLSHLAELQEDQGDPQKARAFYQQALAISREIKDRVGESANLNRLGLLASVAGNRPEAINLFEQALRINTEVGARYEGALALHNLGLVHDRAGDSQLALDYFNKALAVFREIENRSGEAMLRYRVASVQKKLGRTDEASHNIVAALEIVETIRGKIASTDLRSSYFATVQESYDLYIELLMSEHRAHPNDNFAFQALQASEQARARSLLDLLREAKADVRQGVDAQLLTRETELLELINTKATAQVKAFGDPKQANLAKILGEEISGLAIEYETLQAKIRQSSPRYAELVQTTPLTLAGIQSLLDDQTLLLEYRLGAEHSYLWVASQTELKSFELPARAEIESLSRRFYELLTERNRSSLGETSAQKQSRIQTADKELQEKSERLSQILLGPVATSVADKRLVVVVDGQLQYVPFGALVGATTGQGSNLGGAEIISLPSIAVLAQLRRENVGRTPTTKSVAVFADPVFESDDPRLGRFAKRKRGANGSLQQSLRDFDFGPNARGLPRLFASRDEAKAIMALAPSGANYAALDFEANRERALRPDLSQYRVLHFATHGLLNTVRPQLSGVVLSLYDEKGNERDGFLRLDQIYNLRLSSELVVLSACSTALGKEIKGEGMIGLTRGFMYAGAQRVVASLWKVDDEATAELMKLFYRNLLQQRMPASLALRTAQVEMQRQARWRSPYYWGAFTLQGDWR